MRERHRRIYLSHKSATTRPQSVTKDSCKHDKRYNPSLRHTFATVCQQYVRPDIVDIWMGDSTTRLVGKVYTHFPDEFMLENMLKVQFTQE